MLRIGFGRIMQMIVNILKGKGFSVMKIQGEWSESRILVLNQEQKVGPNQGPSQGPNQCLDPILNKCLIVSNSRIIVYHTSVYIWKDNTTRFIFHVVP